MKRRSFLAKLSSAVVGCYLACQTKLPAFELKYVDTNETPELWDETIYVLYSADYLMATLPKDWHTTIPVLCKRRKV